MLDQRLECAAAHTVPLRGVGGSVGRSFRGAGLAAAGRSIRSGVAHPTPPCSPPPPAVARVYVRADYSDFEGDVATGQSVRGGPCRTL